MDKKPPASDYSSVEPSDGIERLYDAHEVAARCKVSEKSLHKWARQGVIPAVKLVGSGALGKQQSNTIQTRDLRAKRRGFDWLRGRQLR